MEQNNFMQGGEKRIPNATMPVFGKPAAKKNEFISDKKDFLFAVLYFAFAYIYIWGAEKTFLIHWNFNHIAIPILTAIYVLFVLAYLHVRGRKPAKESWFWLAVMVCLSIPLMKYSIEPATQLFLLHVAAVYWTVSAADILYKKETSNWILLDGITAFFILPFANIISGVQTMIAQSKNTKLAKKIAMSMLGIVIAIPIACIILPLLASADPIFADKLIDALNWFGSNFGAIFARGLWAIPIASLLFGLSYGSVRRVHSNIYNEAEVRAVIKTARIVPNMAIVVALIVVALIYALFIFMQGQYMFSAFAGKIPEGFSYAEYARNGFFELCRIGSINVWLLLGANLLSRTERVENKALRVSNLFISIISLLLVGIAASKMMLYIGYYGLTIKRILVSTFLIWLAIVFLLVCMQQFRQIKLVKISVMMGAVLICMLSILPVEALVEEYNDAHVVAGNEYASEYIYQGI